MLTTSRPELKDGDSSLPSWGSCFTAEVLGGFQAVAGYARQLCAVLTDIKLLRSHRFG